MPKPTTKEDPNVRIPSAVRAAAARADAAFNEVNGVTPPPDTPTDGVKSGEVNTLPDGSAFVVEEVPLTPPAAEVTPQGNPPAELPNPPTPAPTQNDTVDWKHRYESMKGRHDRLQNDMRTMSDQIANLQNVIATMQQPAAAPELQTSRLITPEEENEFGQEFLTVVGKRAKEEVLPEVAALKSEIERLNNRLETVTTTSSTNARRNMEETLDDKVPNWREINYDENFHAWLKLPDTYSGVIRHQLLSAAYDRNDTARVLAFFTGFLAEEAAVAPAPAELASPDTGKIPLETLAAPGRAKTAAASVAPAEKPTFTRAQIAQFYSDSAAGKYRGKEKEKDRIEHQIFDAEREGRIR